MNLADTEIVNGILKDEGYIPTTDKLQADVILLNTCSVRENAEKRIYGRIGNLKHLKKKKPGLLIGILGCMAERLKEELLEQEEAVDLIIGPDEYRRLPDFLLQAERGGRAVGVKLSRTETYEDIEPSREGGLQAWIPVMRGCDKFCSYCIVPFTRGRERSRPAQSVIDEITALSQQGYREVTLLGQNVNSYSDANISFPDLLAKAASVDNQIRIRFTTSHPQDLSEKLLETIASYDNVCNHIHLPLQSGSDNVLKNMNRSYTIEHYLRLIEKARDYIPGVSFTTDIICGFPGETDADHKATLDVMQIVRYDGAFMFKYSVREGTKAAKMTDDVDEEIKSRRLEEIIALQQRISTENNRNLIGSTVLVLIESTSKKSDDFFSGRTDTNKIVVFPAAEGMAIGDYAKLLIDDATSATLIGKAAVKETFSAIDSRERR